MKTIWRTAILSAGVVGFCFWLMACASPPSQDRALPSSQSPPAQVQEKQYDLKGKIVSVDKAARQVSVDGEDIPGFMGPMTMSYPVKNEQVLDTLAPGDQITATLVSKSGSEYWLESIAVVGKDKK